ncbi:MAG: hypothetical protein K2Q34_06475 [Alphaproteobacteria bacterium]|nr:hypothetical protein [Alphaproteobacteria bacterium]
MSVIYLFFILFVGFSSYAEAMDFSSLDGGSLNFESKHNRDELVSSANKRLKTVTPPFVAEFSGDAYSFYFGTTNISMAKKEGKKHSSNKRVTTTQLDRKPVAVTPEIVMINNGLAIEEQPQEMKNPLYGNPVVVSPEIGMFNDDLAIEENPKAMEELFYTNRSAVSPEEGGDTLDDKDFVTEVNSEEMEITRALTVVSVKFKKEENQRDDAFIDDDFFENDHFSTKFSALSLAADNSAEIRDDSKVKRCENPLSFLEQE